MIGTEDGSETGDAKELVDLPQNNNAKRTKIHYRYLGRNECIKVFYNTFIFAK